jgi:hypothetical protein
MAVPRTDLRDMLARLLDLYSPSLVGEGHGGGEKT